MKNNLKSIYNSLNELEINNAKGWYKNASLFAENISLKYSVSYDKVCGVMSALSPACPWERNKRDAEFIVSCYVAGEDYSNYGFATYGQNIRKAWDILTSNKPVISFFNLKTGAKTYNFYLNILNPASPEYVTIDRHAIAAYNGAKKSGAVSVTPKQYQVIATAYKALAKKLKMLPCELQAIVWEYQVSNFQYAKKG